MSSQRHVITIAGTHGYDDTWKRAGSPVCRHLESLGCAIDDGFVWSTDLGGIGFGSGDLRIWEASGVNLFQYAVPPRCVDQRIPPRALVLLTHSHGLQVALFALARGLRADVLIDVCGPVRNDMLPVARLARVNVRDWVHIHAGRRDRWQWFGTIGDGAFGIVREHPLARNVRVPKADHSEVLNLPAYFSLVGQAAMAAAEEAL